MKTIKIAILGAGNMGTAMAQALALNGHEIYLWDFFPSVIKDIRENQTNERFLPDIRLLKNVHASTSRSECVRGAELVITSVPSSFLVSTLSPALVDLEENAILLNVAKGFAPDNRLPLPFTIEELASGHQIVHLAGPTLANELARGMLAAIVLASEDQDASSKVSNWFSGPSFIPTTSTDIIGASLAGILKNVYVILMGYLSKQCDNSRNLEAATTLACIREMTAIAVAHGAQKETLYGIAGLGDLIATSFSHHSHNRKFGKMLGNGHSLSDLEKQLQWLPEGARSTACVCSLAREKNIRAPLAELVHQLLKGEQLHYQQFLTVLRHESASSRNTNLT